MKISINNLINIALILLCLFFGTLWYMQGSGYKKKLKEADKRIEAVEKVRDSLKLVNKKLTKDYIDIQKSISDRDKKIKTIEKELELSRKNLNLALADAEKKRKEMEESKRRIKKLKDNPIKREGDDLINSLIDKLKN